MSLDPNFVTKQERERRLKAAQKETKVAKTISIPISYWALLDQVRNKLGKKNANETIMYCIKEIAIEEGLESWKIVNIVCMKLVQILIVKEIIL